MRGKSRPALRKLAGRGNGKVFHILVLSITNIDLCNYNMLSISTFETLWWIHAFMLWLRTRTAHLFFGLLGWRASKLDDWVIGVIVKGRDKVRDTLANAMEIKTVRGWQAIFRICSRRWRNSRIIG